MTDYLTKVEVARKEFEEENKVQAEINKREKQQRQQGELDGAAKQFAEDIICQVIIPVMSKVVGGIEKYADDVRTKRSNIMNIVTCTGAGHRFVVNIQCDSKGVKLRTYVNGIAPEGPVGDGHQFAMDSALNAVEDWLGNQLIDSYNKSRYVSAQP